MKTHRFTVWKGKKTFENTDVIFSCFVLMIGERASERLATFLSESALILVVPEQLKTIR